MSTLNDVIVKMVAKSLTGIFSAIKDTKMQRAVLAERLKDIDSDTISELLHYFVSRSEEGDRVFKPLISCFLDIPYLVKVIGNRKMSEIYNMLEEKGYYDVRALLVPHPTKGKRAYEDEILPFPEMDSVPLGMKKTLAKTSEKHTLDKLIYEEDPIVVRHLLNNQKITEKDVLKIITRRPIKMSILREVIKSKRWIDRYIIKKAIIRNPYAPTDIALNLLHNMLLPDLTVIAQDAGLHYTVRKMADKLINKKKRSKVNDSITS